MSNIINQTDKYLSGRKIEGKETKLLIQIKHDFRKNSYLQYYSQNFS